MQAANKSPDSFRAKDWRESLMESCGPGVLAGISFQDWLTLLRRHGRQIDFCGLPRAISITIQSLKTSVARPAERRKWESFGDTVKLRPPLFILGHWRNGTTHLHQLMAQDPRFAFPNTYQTSFPHTFLSSEAFDSKLLAFFIPRRRPMDNVGISLSTPQEDEFALCATCLLSPYMAWVFPRQREHFSKYLTFKGVDPDEVAQWKAAFLHFVRKLQCRYDRPLILKSPPHTARIRFLLELFPEANFVHIHRNPFRVFQSTHRLFRVMLKWHGLQKAEIKDLDDLILNQYEEMYTAFFEQKSLIPAGRFHEIAFEELERSPIEELSRIYQALNLPDFMEFQPNLRGYLDSLHDYQKNNFPELPLELKKRIAEKWRVFFEEWGYALN